MTFEFGAFAIFVVAFRFVPPLTIVILPTLLVVLFILSVGISLLLSVMTVYFRDIKFIWQIFLQALFFVSPIIYQLNLFPENIKNILQMNPLVTILDTAHDLVLYGTLPTPKAIFYMLGTTAIIFIIGYVVFQIKSKRLIEEL
jgi:ABC-type polysaccharide/polyol phosphate export permease